MSTAELTAKEQQASRSFQMPTVHVGMMVNHYPNGLATQQPTPLWVNKVRVRTIELTNLVSTAWMSVRHVEDPELEMNPEARKDAGAWDYTPDYKQILEDRQQLKIIKNRCDQLVARLDDAETELGYLKSLAKESENSTRKDNDRKGK